MMKERPILMSAPMVRSTLDDSKTHTRRIIKLPHMNPLGQWEPADIGGDGMFTEKGEPVPPMSGMWHTRTGDTLMCPYGQPGDRLWVRETWADVGTMDPGLIVYRADYPACVPANYENVPSADSITWKPSIHMFRRHSRITLEIVSVRVERLQDISEADAIAEGIERSPEYPTLWKRGPLHGDQNTVKVTNVPKLAYRSIWEQINGYESWAANPWVWVISFRRLPRDR